MRESAKRTTVSVLEEKLLNNKTFGCCMPHQPINNGSQVKFIKNDLYKSSNKVNNYNYSGNCECNQCKDDSSNVCLKITTLLPLTNQPHIYLDLTNCGYDKTSVNTSQEDVYYESGLKQTICVPRKDDYLSTWRTCMVPAHDIEHFAKMKPPTRKWKVVDRPTSPGNVLLFTLLCYNILSDQYANKHHHCQPWALSWHYRRQAILEDIVTRSPTIICLQEVETDKFYSYFLPQLSTQGYDGIFSAKSRAKTMNLSQKKRVDGCAILWKRSKFRMVAQHVIEFNKTYLNTCWRASDRSSVLHRVMSKDNIAIAAVLEPRHTLSGESPLMVSTAHIHWDPQYSDVKLIQTMILTAALRDKMTEYQQIYNSKGSIPLVLCGDFNSLPNSGVTQFLLNGKINKKHPEFNKLGEDPSLQHLCYTSSQQLLTHTFQLNSCYDTKSLNYSNYTKDFKGVIDYVFVSKRGIKTMGYLQGISNSWYREQQVVGCPHPYVPSDHIPLLVELQLQ